MRKYLVSEDCIERFLCKTQNVKDSHGKHILLGVTELAGYMMNESIDFDILCDGLYKLKELAESGIKTAEKKIDSDLFENIESNISKLLELVNKVPEEDIGFVKLMDEANEFLRKKNGSSRYSRGII